MRAPRLAAISGVAGGAALLAAMLSPAIAASGPAGAAVRPAASRPAAASRPVATRPAAATGNLTIAQAQAITTLNEDTATQTPAEYEALGLVADSLYGYFPGSDQLQPDLASSATHSANGLTWTFHLRKGIRFSNGAPVTSADVKATFEWETKQPLEGGNYKEITGIATPNADTVVFTTDKPDVTFLTKVASYNVAIVPAGFDGESASTFWKDPIGDGPFMVESFQPGVKMVLKKNPYYWNAGAVHVSTITMEPVPDENTAALKLESGEVNVIDSVPNSEVDTLQSRPGVTVRQIVNGAAYFLILNNKIPALSDLEVRKAISLALDRQAMVASSLLGHGTVAGSWLAASVLGGYIPPFGKQYSLAQAKALLAKTPYKSGFTVSLPYNNQDPIQQVCAQIVQSDLAQLKIKVALDGETGTAAGNALTSHNYGLAFGTIFWNGDAGDVIGYYVSTDGWYAQSAIVPKVSSMLTQALAVFDNAKRMADYQKIIALIADDAGNIGLVSPNTYFATASDIASIPTEAGGAFYQYTVFK
jgi:peptide/nickel transport system substrate-binding protein